MTARLGASVQQLSRREADPLMASEGILDVVEKPHTYSESELGDLCSFLQQAFRAEKKLEVHVNCVPTTENCSEIDLNEYNFLVRSGGISYFLTKRLLMNHIENYGHGMFVKGCRVLTSNSRN